MTLPTLHLRAALISPVPSVPYFSRSLSPARLRAVIVIVSGVAGSGKTTVGTQLAKRLGWRFADADGFHSAANVAKMRAGFPLTDADRAPWLRAITGWMDDIEVLGESGVITCSALRRRYRDELLSGRPLEALRSDRARVTSGELHPKDVKVAFAKEIVTRFHGPEAAEDAAEEFERRFARREMDPAKFPEVVVGTGGKPVPLARAMVDARLIASTSEARRLISQGAVKVGGERITDPKAELPLGTHLVQVGKLRAARLTVR